MSDVKIELKGGSQREMALTLIAAALATDHPANVVRVTTNGFLVPDEVAKKAGYGDEPQSDSKAEDTTDEAPKQAAKKPAKKAATKRSTAKKTAAKKTAASKE